MLTKDEFMARLRRRVAGNQERFAARVGVSQAYISQVINEKVSPSEKVCREMGYRRVVLYEPI